MKRAFGPDAPALFLSFTSARPTVIVEHFWNRRPGKPVRSVAWTLAASPGQRRGRGTWAANTTRNPLFLLRLFGFLLLRRAARAFVGLLIHDPPRTTRGRSQGA